MIMFRATFGLLVFGAVFVWFGVATPFWSSLAWVGAILLFVGIAAALSSLRPIRDNTAVPPAPDFKRRERPSGLVEVPAFRTKKTTTWEVDEIRVRCTYCGTENEVDSSHCTSCGAALT